ncbi:MAK10-like protein [Tanacetum coccineum]
MRDANPIRTLGDYSKPSYEGYKNTIELPEGNNVDPNQHLKDFLKLVDLLDLNGDNRESTRLRLFQLSLRDQASNWLERLPAGSITTWEDLTTRFLAHFFPPGRTAKLRNDILIRTIDQSAGGKLRDRNAKESWALLEDLALCDNESWNDPRYFGKPVNAISLPQDVLSTSDRRLIELKDQVQRLMEAYIAPMQPTQVKKITSSCEICSGPHDTQYCMENLEQAFVDYASSLTNEMGSRHPRNGSFSTYSFNYQTKLEKTLIDFDSHQEKRLSSLRAQLGQQQDDMISKINLLWKTISEKLDDTPIRNTAGSLAAQMNFTSTNDPAKEDLRGKGIKSPSKLLSSKYLSQSSLAEQNRNPSSPKRVHFVKSIVILNKEDESMEEGNVKSSTTEYEDHKMTVESEEEFKEETE